MYCLLKAMQDWIETNSTFNSKIGFSLKLTEQCDLIVLVKGVYNLISKAYKAIDIMYRHLQIFVQQPYGRRKRSAVSICGKLTALLTYFMKQGYHNNIYEISWNTELK